MADPAALTRYRSGAYVGTAVRLVREIDGGGMGAIWEGHHEALDMPVAVKLVHAELSTTSAAERLLSEARILARLDHPAIVRVLDCGRTPQGDPYVIMELLNGACLSDHLGEVERLSSIAAVETLLPIVDALRVVHEAGVVHRDIKPDNVFLATSGAGNVQPKLIDFGIAISDYAGGRLTTHGLVLGSPAYMSPEQALGETNISASSDVWSLSVVLFELITGGVPFLGESYNATLRAIIDQECPDLEALGVDPLLASILERGLEKEPAKRWPSMKALGTALAQWLYGQGVTEDAARVSLRAAWLGREATASFPPVAAPARDRSSRPSQRRPVVAAERSSTHAIAVTRRATSRRRRSLGVVVALALGLLALGVGLWRAQNAHVPQQAHLAAALTPVATQSAVQKLLTPPPSNSVAVDTASAPAAADVRDAKEARPAVAPRKADSPRRVTSKPAAAKPTPASKVYRPALP
ncbi:MAG: protein kinase [Polyangiaceae bacterium]